MLTMVDYSYCIPSDIYTEVVAFKQQDRLGWGVAFTEVIENMLKDIASKVKVITEVSLCGTVWNHHVLLLY